MKSGVTKYILPICIQYISPPIKQAYHPSFLMTTVCLFFIFAPAECIYTAKIGFEFFFNGIGVVTKTQQ